MKQKLSLLELGVSTTPRVQFTIHSCRNSYDNNKLKGLETKVIRDSTWNFNEKMLFFCLLENNSIPLAPPNFLTTTISISPLPRPSNTQQVDYRSSLQIKMFTGSRDS